MKGIVPEGYVCQPTTGPITIDGKMNEPDWEKAPWTADFQDIEGAAKPKPRFRTRAKMLWDDEYFYIAAELEEPHIWGTLTNHDAVIFNDPDFEVFIDPDGDRQEYYEFEMNALNTTWDLLLKKTYKDGGPALNEWEIPGSKTAVYIKGTLNNPADQDQGWSVEIAFPWKALAQYANKATPPKEGDQWRVDFSRVEWQINIVNGRYEKVKGTPENNWIWSPPGVVDMHRPEKWGYVQFTRKPAAEVKFVPDEQLKARNELMEIYYAQKDYQAKNHRWAAAISDLPFAVDVVERLSKTVKMKLTADGFEAVHSDRAPEHAPVTLQSVRVRQDGRLWVTK